MRAWLATSFHLPITLISKSYTDWTIPIAGSFLAAKNRQVTKFSSLKLLKCASCKNVKRRSTADAALAAVLSAAPENLPHLKIFVVRAFRRLISWRFGYLCISDRWKLSRNRNSPICLAFRNTCYRQMKRCDWPCPHFWLSKSFMMCKFSFETFWDYGKNISRTAPLSTWIVLNIGLMGY